MGEVSREFELCWALLGGRAEHSGALVCNNLFFNVGDGLKGHVIFSASLKSFILQKENENRR